MLDKFNIQTSDLNHISTFKYWFEKRYYFRGKCIMILSNRERRYSVFSKDDKKMSSDFSKIPFFLICYLMSKKKGSSFPSSFTKKC